MFLFWSNQRSIRGSGAIRKLINHLYRAADLLLVHTEYEARYFKQHGLSNRAIVVGNGIEDRNDGLGSRFRDQHGVTGRMILFVGRKDADKGYRLVVQAFAGVRNKLNGAVLVSSAQESGMLKQCPECWSLGLPTRKQSTIRWPRVICVRPPRLNRSA